MCAFFHLFNEIPDLVLEFVNIDTYIVEYLIYWIPPQKIYSPEGLGFLSVRYLDNSRCKHYPESRGGTQLSSRVLQNMLQAYKAGTASRCDVLSKALETGKYVEWNWVTGNSWLNWPCWNWPVGSPGILNGAISSATSCSALSCSGSSLELIQSLTYPSAYLTGASRLRGVQTEDSTDSGKGCKPIWGSTGGRKGKVGLSWQIPTAIPSRGRQTALGRGDWAPQRHAFFPIPVGSFPKALKHSAVKLFPQ